VEPLIAKLHAAGYDVQLEHDEKETSWESHGYVVLRDAAGNELAKLDDYQHNMKFRDRESRADELVALVEKSISTVTAAA